MNSFALLGAMAVALFAAAGTGTILARLGFPLPDEDRRIGCVDGLRGYLALFVMMHHFDLWVSLTQADAPWGASSLRVFENFGQGGVALFFMTTGLVFYPRVLRGSRAVDWTNVYISRIFRILPLQLVTIAIALAIALIMVGGQPQGSLAATLRSLTMWVTGYAEPPLLGFAQAGLINAKVLWSLWYEWLFYLFLLPGLAIARDLTRTIMPSWVAPAALLLIGLALGQMMTPPTFWLYLPLFACGMLAYELRDRLAIRQLLSTAPAAFVAAGLLVLAMVFAKGPYALPQILAYALFFACVACGNSFGGVLALRGSVALGESSFGIYLIHGITLFILFTFLLPADAPAMLVLGTLPVAAICAVLLSAAAHIGVERPAMRMGKWIARLRRTRQIDGAAVEAAS